MSQEAYLNLQGDPVSGPDHEDLQQWLADNPGKTPSDSPLVRSHASYLAKDGNFYRTASETPRQIGRHARLLQGEIEAFENRANVKTGQYLDVLLAASGAGGRSTRTSNGKPDYDKVKVTSKSNKEKSRQGKTAKDSSKNERKGDQGRAEVKYERQIGKLEVQLKTLQGREKKKVLEKIKNIKKNAQRKRKGEEHSRIGKQGRGK